MYYIIFFTLVVLGLYEIITRKNIPVLFNVIYVAMTCMAAFRYGQLTDYPNYELFYNSPESFQFEQVFTKIMLVSNKAGLTFTHFNIILAVVMMGMAYPFFSKTCQKSFISLLVFYVYVFLILHMSAVRQGLAFSFLLVGVLLLFKEKRRWFYFLIAIGSLFHYSLILAFLIGLCYDLKVYNKEPVVWIVVGLTLFALFTPDLTEYIPDIFADRSLGKYEENRTIQIGLRFLLVFPVLTIKPSYGTLCYKAKAIYVIGYCLYCVLAFSTLISGRIEFYFRVFLCLFASQVIFSLKQDMMKKVLMAFVILIHVVLFYKNINSFIGQGNYGHNITMFNFPYISIFD